GIEAVGAALAALDDTRVPELAGVVHVEPLGIRGNRVRLRTYSDYDPLDLPLDVARKIHLFNERPVPAAIEQAKEAGVELTPATARALFACGILGEKTPRAQRRGAGIPPSRARGGASCR